jgi:hypothetical protein
MEEIGGECVLIGGWASYLHLRNVALSHDVDTILDPLHDKERVSALIGAVPTHLGKLSGELHSSHVDLYVPYTSVIRDLPVEKILPYRTKIEGINVLIPEAHLLTKMACVVDDKRYASERADKDVSEVKGMMNISDPATSTAIWASVSKSSSKLSHEWNLLLSRVKANSTKRELKQGLDAVLRTWESAINSVSETISDTYTLSPTERVMFAPDGHGKIVRFHFKNKLPNTVETLIENNWTNSRSVMAGDGKHILSAAVSTHPLARTIPSSIMRDYAEVHTSCLLCGKPLSDPSSLRRGYGTDCETRVR